MEPRNRLVKLIEHWIQHNASHATRYRDAAKEAESDGYREVAVQLRRAAELETQVTAALHAALTQIT